MSDKLTRTIPKIEWLPRPTTIVRGKIARSVFEPCFCHEETKNGKPRRTCKRCRGKGGRTMIWVEPLVIDKGKLR